MLENHPQRCFSTGGTCWGRLVPLTVAGELKVLTIAISLVGVLPPSKAGALRCVSAVPQSTPERGVPVFLFRVPCSGILKWERRRGTRQPGPRGTSQNRRRRPKRRILTSRTTIGSHFYVTFPIRPFALIGQARIAPQADPLRQAGALPQNSSLFKAAAGTKRLPASSGCRRQAAAGSKRPPAPSGRRR